MISLEQVQRARAGDQKLQTDIYRQIFFDKLGNDKVTGWLVLSRIPQQDLEMLKSDLRFIFTKTLMKDYVHDQIPFEKFVWTRFKFVVIQYFSKRSADHRKGLVMVHLAETEEDDEVGVGATLADTSQVIADLPYDFEQLIAGFSLEHRRICRRIAYNQLKNSELLKLKLWPLKEIVSARALLREQIRKYLRNL